MVDYFFDDFDAIKKKDVIKEMAEAAQEDAKSRIDTIFAATITGLMHPISPVENQMFQVFTQQPYSPAYNSSAKVGQSYPMDAELALSGCQLIADRHDIMRTSYHMSSDGQGGKRISEHFMGDCHALFATGTLHDTFDTMHAGRPFQLGIAPARFYVLSMHNDRRKSQDEAGQTVGIAMHHVIADGDGIGIASVELELIMNFLFRGFSIEGTRNRLPPVTVQFQDYSYWLASLEGRGLLNDELAVWFSQLTSSGPPEVLDIPMDYPRQRTFVNLGDSIMVSVDQALCEPVLKLSPSTPYSVVFTYFSIAMSRLTQKANHYCAIAWGTRPFPALYPLIGSFVNMLPIHYPYYASESVGTCIDRMAAVQLTARKNCSAPFLTINNQIKSYNNPPFDPSRNPVYQTLLDLIPFGNEYNYADNGILDLWCFLFAPGGNVSYLQAVLNTTIVTRRTAVVFLNQCKAIALYSGQTAALGPVELHTTPIPEILPNPELGIKQTQGINLGTFVLKLNQFDEVHDDAADEDCEVSLIAGPEPAGVPDEYDFFRRSKVFLQCSCIMPTVDVTHEFAPQFQQPPLVEPKRGQILVLPTPQSTEVDENYQKKFAEPILYWQGPTEATAVPREEILEGTIKFFDVEHGHGMITMSDESKDDVMFTASSIPIKERPTKKNPVDLTGEKVSFSYMRGLNMKYAAGLNFMSDASVALVG